MAAIIHLWMHTPYMALNYKAQEKKQNIINRKTIAHTVQTESPTSQHPTLPAGYGHRISLVHAENVMQQEFP